MQVLAWVFTEWITHDIKKRNKKHRDKNFRDKFKKSGKTYVLHADNIGNIISIETDDNEIIEYALKIGFSKW